MRDRISLLLGTAFYIGCIPGAPGTYASAVTSTVLYFYQARFHRVIPELYVSVLGLVTIVGVLASAEVSRIKDDEDPSIVVIDEVAGQLLTFLYLPLHFWNLLLGTFFFRVFDVWKPFPIRQLESLKNGVGIMADDLMAGVYSCRLLHLVNRLLHW